MLKNYGGAPRDAYVTLTVDGKNEPAASRRVLLPPGEKTAVVLTFEPRTARVRQGSRRCRSRRATRSPIDDVAYGRVPQARKMPVAHRVATRYSWIARALDADPDLDVQKLTPSQVGNVNVDPDALVVVEGACPDNPPASTCSSSNPPAGNCLGVDVAKEVEQPQITSWEKGDPRLRFLTLDGVHVAQGDPGEDDRARPSLASRRTSRR